MDDTARGLPLLSGPPPPLDPSTVESACRKCSKEFNVIFTRSRKCNHCGYAYCHSCSDYQALAPRTGMETGYDVMNVCAFCVEYLNMTASGRNHLKSLSLSKLKKYITAYNIKIDRAVEKDDLIDAIISAREPNGCLPRSNEHYYRLYSVPNKSQPRSRGLFSRSGQSSHPPPPPPPPPQHPPSQRNEFARPDLAPDNLQQPPHPPRNTRPVPQQQYNPPPQPPPRPRSANPTPSPYSPSPQFHTPPPRSNPHSYYQSNQYNRPQGPPPPQNYNTRPAYPRPTQTSGPPPPTPPRPRAMSQTPPPTLARLLTMEVDDIKSLSVHALKDILFTNHVNAGQILEKSDLVTKVLVLIEDEKRERERQRLAEEREQLEMMRREEERQAQIRERALAAERERQAQGVDSGGETGSPPGEAGVDAQAAMRGGDASGEDIPGTASPQQDAVPPRTSPPIPTSEAPKTQGSAVTLERTGLCVICQDEEANIAIVDCGHMAMCRGCSELIMSSSRECPLCRTRIVTEARLLRIFKT